MTLQLSCGSLRRGCLIGLAALAVALLAADPARAMCDVIPGLTGEFRGALGTLNRPFAIPGDDGQQLIISLDAAGCDAASTGFIDLLGGATPEDDYFITVLFKPPGGATRNAVVLTTQANQATCQTRVASALGQLGGGTASCLVREAGTLELRVLNPSTLSFRFPDTDAQLAPDGDDRTFTGPVAIAVTRISSGLPFSLATSRCANSAGLVACIDELYAKNGVCDTAPRHRDPIFSHFVGLPPPNNYQALCTTAQTECQGTASELRFAVDAEGNALVPMDWRGVLLRPDGLPIARLVRGNTSLAAFSDSLGPIRLPGPSFVASFSTDGLRLPPIFQPVSEGGAPAELGLFGTVDAEIGVIRVARRAADLSGVTPLYQQCLGGANDGLPCVVAEDCPSGSCGPATCHADNVATQTVCKNDAQCGALQECGPSLFDLSDRLEQSVGPGLVASSDFEADAENPVPLEGLIESRDLFAFVQIEALGAPASPGGPLQPRDLNGDLDKQDAVVTLRSRETGVLQPIGVGGAEGNAAVRIQQPPFSFPAVAVEGTVAAFLEPEPDQDFTDANGDGEVFDSILRVYRLNPDCGGGTPCAEELTAGSDLAIDAAPQVGGRSLVISNGLVFYRMPEAANARHATVSYPTAEDTPDLSRDGRHVAFWGGLSSSGVLDRDSDMDGVFDEVGGTLTVSLGSTGPPRLSENGRFVAYRVVAGGAVATVRDRDTDADGIFDEVGATSTTSLGIDETVLLGVSNSGRHVCLDSDSDAVVPGDSNLTRDVFVRDRDTEADGLFDEPGAIRTTRLSVADDGSEGRDFSGFPKLTGDGRHAVFVSSAPNLVRGDTNEVNDFFVSDRDADGNGVFDEPGGVSIERVSVTATGDQSNFDGGFLIALEADISSDGKTVVFASEASNMVAGDTNGITDVFVRDRANGTTTLASRNVNGSPLELAGPLFTSVSHDGRYVVYDLESPLAVFPPASVIQLYDRVTGLTKGVSPGTERSLAPSISEDAFAISYLNGDGGFVVTGVDTSDLRQDVSGDGDLRDTLLRVFETETRADRPVCPAEQVEIEAGNAVFLRPERDGVAANCPSGGNPMLPADLNRDGDVSDEVVHLWTGGAVANLSQAATLVALSTDWIGALVSEAGQGGADLNRDGDSGDRVVAVHPMGAQGAWTNLEIAADALDVAGRFVAFITDDRVFRIYDAETASLIPVDQVAEEFVLGERIAAFRSRESAAGVDLNDDGDTDDDVLQVYDLVTRQLFNTGKAVTLCRFEACDPRVPYRVVGDAVTFLTLESDQGSTDLDGDGDAQDVIVQTFNARQAALLAAPPASLGQVLSGAQAGICTDTAAACASDADCPAGSCFLPPGGCVEDLGIACSPDFPGDCTEHQFCEPVFGSPGIGSCHVVQGPCQSDADCTAPALCRDGTSDVVRLLSPLAPKDDGEQVYVGAGLRVAAEGTSCASDADCAESEICNAAGVCQEDRKELTSVGAADTDGDGVADPFDNCVHRLNADQADADLNEVGDTCDLGGADGDGDGLPDPLDNCPFAANDDQADADGDDNGDACECGDASGDGRVNTLDARIIQRCADGGIAQCPSLCDTTGDGLCNGADVQRVREFDVGLLEKVGLTCEEKTGAVSPVRISACGLGFEVAMLLLPIGWLRRRRPLRAGS